MEKPENHTNQELSLMLSGKKPMAVFYRATHEFIDEKGGQDFDRFVREGIFDRTIFYIKDEDHKIIYYIYTLKSQKWRAKVYKLLKKENSFSGWQDEMEYIEGFLLGYSHEENISHLNYISQFRD